jgi:methyl-accepting chemotaxis protein
MSLSFFRRAEQDSIKLACNLVQQLAVPAFLLDAQGKVAAWNEACETLTGLAAKDMLGTRDHWRGFYPKQRPCLADVMFESGSNDAAYANLKLDRLAGRGRAENWCDLPGGGRRYLIIDAALVRDEKNQLIGVIETLGDKTAEQEALAKLNEEQALSRRQAQNEQKQVVADLAAGLRALAEGNLDCLIMRRFPESYEELRSDFNGAVRQLGSIIARLTESSRSVASTAETISQNSDGLAQRAEHQAAMLEETGAAQREIGTTVEETLRISREAGSEIDRVKANASHSRGVVDKTIEAMRAIEGSSSKIGQVITVIDEIAFQTNLLALNAGVEAARAGDAGRGFAVVALEVRALAQRSAEAAKEIKQMVAQSGVEVEHGVTLVNETGRSLHAIFDEVAGVADRFRAITEAAGEQSIALREVEKALRELDSVTQQNAQVADRNASACSDLRAEAAEVASLVRRFRLGAETPAQRVA